MWLLPDDLRTSTRAVILTKPCLQSVEGMKVLCFELMEASGGRASPSTLTDLAASANELVVELTRRVYQVRQTLFC